MLSKHANTAMFLMTTSAFGSGVLTLPYALLNCGTVFGVCVFLYGAIQSALANVYLAQLGQRYEARSYGDLLETLVMGGTNSLWRKEVIVMFDFMFYVYLMTAIVSFMIFLADFGSALSILIQQEFILEKGQTPIDIPRPAIIYGVALVAFPFCLVDKITKLSCLGGFSLSALTFVVVVVVMKSLCQFIMMESIHVEVDVDETTGEPVSTPSPEGSRLSELALYPENIGIGLNSFAIVIFAYVNQMNTIPIMSEFSEVMITQFGLDQAARAKQIQRACIMSSIIICLLYLIVSFSVCFSFGRNTNPDFLTDYARTDSLMIISKVLLIFMLLLAVVINMFPCTQSLYRFLNAIITSEATESSGRAEDKDDITVAKKRAQKNWKKNAVQGVVVQEGRPVSPTNANAMDASPDRRQNRDGPFFPQGDGFHPGPYQSNNEGYTRIPDKFNNTGKCPGTKGSKGVTGKCNASLHGVNVTPSRQTSTEPTNAGTDTSTENTATVDTTPGSPIDVVVQSDLQESLLIERISNCTLSTQATSGESETTKKVEDSFLVRSISTGITIAMIAYAASNIANAAVVASFGGAIFGSGISIMIPALMMVSSDIPKKEIPVRLIGPPILTAVSITLAVNKIYTMEE